MTNKTDALAGNLLGLDIGKRRIGLAITSTVARLPRTLCTLENNKDFTDRLKSIIQKENISLLVAGLPRGLGGHDTEQTRWVRQFVSKLKEKIDLPVILQDETLSSVMAEEELLVRKKRYDKVDIDALAAVYILEDYLRDNRDNTVKA